jgi:hypothetical protein
MKILTPEYKLSHRATEQTEHFSLALCSQCEKNSYNITRVRCIAEKQVDENIAQS